MSWEPSRERAVVGRRRARPARSDEGGRAPPGVLRCGFALRDRPAHSPGARSPLLLRPSRQRVLRSRRRGNQRPAVPRKQQLQGRVRLQELQAAAHSRHRRRGRRCLDWHEYEKAIKVHAVVWRRTQQWTKRQLCCYADWHAAVGRPQLRL